MLCGSKCGVKISIFLRLKFFFFFSQKCLEYQSTINAILLLCSIRGVVIQHSGTGQNLSNGMHKFCLDHYFFSFSTFFFEKSDRSPPWFRLQYNDLRHLNLFLFSFFLIFKVFLEQPALCLLVIECLPERLCFGSQCSEILNLLINHVLELLTVG